LITHSSFSKKFAYEKEDSFSVNSKNLESIPCDFICTHQTKKDAHKAYQLLAMPHFILLDAVGNATTTFTDDQIMLTGLKHIGFAFQKSVWRTIALNYSTSGYYQIALTILIKPRTYKRFGF
jgi:hypothetical protein